MYKRENKNFDDTKDVGEIWFGESVLHKVLAKIAEDKTIDKENDTVIDLGCGNGETLTALVLLFYFDR